MHGTELQNLQESIIIDVRSFLLSSSDGLTENEINHDYRHTNGYDLPFGRLGYSTMYDFLQYLISIGRIHAKRRGNLTVYYAKDDLQTIGLANLVRGQRDSTIAKREINRLKESRRIQQRNLIRQYYGGLNKSFDAGTTINTTQLRPQSPFVPYQIQSKIRTILERSENKCLTRSEFTRLYYQNFKNFINHEQFGFKSLVEMLSHLKHLIELCSCDYDEYMICLKNIPPWDNVTLNETTKTTTTTTTNGNQVKPVQVSTPTEPPTTTPTTPTNPTIKNTQIMNHHQEELSKMNAAERLGVEVMNNLKILIKKHHDNGGLRVSQVEAEYKKEFKKMLDVQKLGYVTLVQLLEDKLDDFLRFKRPNLTGDYFVLLNDGEGSEDNDDDNKEHNGEGDVYGDDDYDEFDALDIHSHESNLKQLIRHIRYMFKKEQDRCKLYTISEFQQAFEKKFGFKFHFTDYGCRNIDQLVIKLNDYKVFKFQYDENHCPFLQYMPQLGEVDADRISSSLNSINDNGGSINTRYVRQPSSSSGTPTRSTGGGGDGSGVIKEQKSTTSKIDDKIEEKFLREHVSYYDKLDPFKVLENVDLTKEYFVVVSHITDPFEVNIQFHSNIDSLNTLMDDLEAKYCGIGASHYDMNEPYVQYGKYCAAIYPSDNNWHRCKIIDVFHDKGMARVLFIDYGGFADVPIKGIKFLAKRFVQLPQQAVIARLSNLTYLNESKQKWKPDITNYLVNLVREKKFKAKFDGSIDTHLCVTLYDVKGSGQSINKKIIDDGYAAVCDNNLNVNFTPIENSCLNRYGSKMNIRCGATSTSNVNIASSTVTLNKQQSAVNDGSNKRIKEIARQIAYGMNSTENFDNLIDGYVNSESEEVNENEQESSVDVNNNNNVNIDKNIKKNENYKSNVDDDDDEKSESEQETTSSDEYLILPKTQPQINTVTTTTTSPVAATVTTNKVLNDTLNSLSESNLIKLNKNELLTTEKVLDILIKNLKQIGKDIKLEICDAKTPELVRNLKEDYAETEIKIETLRKTQQIINENM